VGRERRESKGREGGEGRREREEMVRQEERSGK